MSTSSSEEPPNDSNELDAQGGQQHASPGALASLSAPLQDDMRCTTPRQTHTDSETDSAYGDTYPPTLTSSLTSSLLNYKYENGRRYHAYRDGEYPLPNDEREQDRLDLQHHVFRLTLDGELFRAPIRAGKGPHRVLDMGTGTGIWAIEFADEFPSALVIGNDLSPIQPVWVPPNCKFAVDDIESDWLYTPAEAFDYIHGRGLGGSIRDWPRLYSEAYKHLKPGGWLEMHEFEAWVKSDDDPEMKNCQSTLQWQTLVCQASEKFGKNLNVAHLHKQMLEDAGFVDVRDDVYKVPNSPWPTDPKWKNVGLYQLEQMCDCIESFTLALLTRVLGWSHEETQVLMAGVRRDFRNRQNHTYCNFHFIHGRKPLASD